MEKQTVHHTTRIPTHQILRPVTNVTLFKQLLVG